MSSQWSFIHSFSTGRHSISRDFGDGMEGETSSECTDQPGVKLNPPLQDCSNLEITAWLPIGL